MLRLVLLAAAVLVGTASCFQNDPECGERPLMPDRDDRIVNGVEALSGDWPWQVSLNNNGRHFCGGSLLNHDWILSAAHCFSGSSAGYTILLGVHDRNNQESHVITRRFGRLFIHPNWNSALLRGDMALIKMSEPLEHYTDKIRPVCLPTSQDALDAHAGHKGHVTGWGAGGIGGPLFPKKMEGSHIILTANRCLQKYGARFETFTQICAGENGDAAGPCQGDSGGPFVRIVNGKWQKIGVVSWGIGCGNGGVYSRVDGYLPWINTTISAN